MLVCRSGRRSGAVARELRETGFERVASMTGGMLQWTAHGYPVADDLPDDVGSTAVSSTAMRHDVTREDIANHVADRDRVRWAKAASLMLHGTQACVDGRDAHGIVGPPGTDAGELVLGLATAESLTATKFDIDAVREVFDAYLDAFGHFYMQSDEHAVAALLDRLHAHDPAASFPVHPDVRTAERFLSSPPASARKALRTLLGNPDFVGCGHLRLMLQHAEEYGVRPGIVRDIMRVDFERLWSGETAIEFVVLEGAHEDSAVVSVELTRDVHAFTRIPLVSPRLRDTEVFVTHPQVARFIRRENAAFLLEEAELPNTDGLDEIAFFQALETLASRQLEATVRHLAPDLPHYRVRFSGDAFEVEGPTVKR